MNYEVSLRTAEAHMIEVVKVDDPEQIERLESAGTLEAHDETELIVHDEHRSINVALIGNPNCGKTTLFNKLSGATEHVGNYSGVTVDAKKTRFPPCRLYIQYCGPARNIFSLDIFAGGTVCA